jgi:TRAP-type mannitol/chloroaromatic compound transport system permease small subunit
MIKYLDWVDTISEWCGKLFAWSVVILTVVVCYEVFMRYVMRMPTRWAYDVGYMLYGAMFFMAGAYALARNAHVRADVIYRFLRPRTQASIDLVLYIIFFFPAAFFFVYSGYFFAERAWVMREVSSASPFNIPVYHNKTLIPLAGAFLFVQGIAESIRCVIAIRHNEWPPRHADVKEIQDQVLEGEVPISVADQLQVETEIEPESAAAAAEASQVGLHKPPEPGGPADGQETKRDEDGGSKRQ